MILVWPNVCIREEEYCPKAMKCATSLKMVNSRHEESVDRGTYDAVRLAFLVLKLWA